MWARTLCPLSSSTLEEGVRGATRRDCSLDLDGAVFLGHALIAATTSLLDPNQPAGIARKLVLVVKTDLGLRLAPGLPVRPGIAASCRSQLLASRTRVLVCTPYTSTDGPADYSHQAQRKVCTLTTAHGPCGSLLQVRLLREPGPSAFDRRIVTTSGPTIFRRASCPEQILLNLGNSPAPVRDAARLISGPACLAGRRPGAAAGGARGRRLARAGQRVSPRRSPSRPPAPRPTVPRPTTATHSRPR